MGQTKVLTVDDLYKICQSERKRGNGKKKIMISSDDEGNSYHDLFFGFTPTIDDKGEPFFSNSGRLPYGVDESEIKDYIILG